MLFTFLRDVFRFFGQHWIPLFVIAYVVGGVTEGLGLFLVASLGESSWLPMAAVQFVGGALASIATVLYTEAAFRKRYLPPMHAIRDALPWLPAIILLQLATFAPVVAGLMLFIVPGVYVAVRLSLGLYIRMLNRQPTLEALKQSWTDTQGYGWTLFGGIMILMIASLLATNLVYAALGLGMSEGNSVGAAVVNWLFRPVGVLVTLFGYRVYTDSQES